MNVVPSTPRADGGTNRVDSYGGDSVQQEGSGNGNEIKYFVDRVVGEGDFRLTAQCQMEEKTPVQSVKQRHPSRSNVVIEIGHHLSVRSLSKKKGNKNSYIVRMCGTNQPANSSS